MGSFHKQHYPVQEALPFPHVAGLTYFRSPPKFQSALRPVTPTSRKMSSIPIVKTQPEGNHQHSSIPRPACLVARSPKKPRLRTPLSTSSLVNLQSSSPTTQARTCSRTKRSSISSGKLTTPPSHTLSLEPPPRSDSLLPYSERLHIKDYSTHSLATVNPTLSYEKDRNQTPPPFPTPSCLPKSNTSTSLTKKPLSLTPQRQLMKPLDPPLPRSQTIGSLSCFAGNGAKETPPPLKSSSNSTNIGTGKELGAMDEIYKQEARETQMNKQRMKQIVPTEKQHPAVYARGFPDPFSRTLGLTMLEDESALNPTEMPKIFGRINVSKNEEMDRKLLRKDKEQNKDDPRPSVAETTCRGLHIDTKLANAIQQTPISLTTPDSAMSFGSIPGDEWEVNIKLVHLRQENSYWAGRLSSLCDRLRTANAHLLPSDVGRALVSPAHQKGLHTKEPFEVAERRRMKYALRELSSCCRTNAALHSFKDFEMQLKGQLDKRAEAQGKLVQGLITGPKEDVALGIKPNSEPKPKSGWHFGHGQNSEIGDKEIAMGSAVAGKQRPMIIKSKTTSNLANMLHGGKDKMAAPSATASSVSDAKSLPGLIWHRPTVHEAQAQAKRIREQRILAKALTYRRVSEQDNGVDAARNSMAVTMQDREADKAWSGGDDAPTDGENSGANGIGQGLHGNELLGADGKQAAKCGHSRKSSGAESRSLKKVFSDSMKGMRKVKRSIRGSGSGSVNERLIG